VSAIAIPRAAFSTMWSMKSLGPWIHKLVASVALAAVMTMMVALCSRTAAFSDYEPWGYDFLVTHRSAERAIPPRYPVYQIYANPVIRGLVQHPKDWPWSSWSSHAKGEPGLVRMDVVK
jgi:hypothetical protein